MPVRRSIPPYLCPILAVLTLLVAPAAVVHAQQPPPWSGIAADEARPASGQASWDGYRDMSPRSLSADARFVIFHSNHTYLVPGDTNNWNDVFLKDRLSGQLTRVSVASDGSQGNHYSAFPTISANGRHIAFNSCATNLAPADTNNSCDLFVHDRELGTTVRFNLGPNGEQAVITTQHHFNLSADGRYAVFNASFAGYARKVWLRDRDADANGVFDEPGTATTTLISESIVGEDWLGAYEDVAISGDGRWIAYVAATNAQGGDYVGNRLYLHDRMVATTVRVDRAMAGGPDILAYASAPDFSDAGHLAYSSNADNLAEGDTDGHDDVYVFDISTGGNTPVELAYPGAPALDYEWAPALSADGRYVAFMGVEDLQYDAFSNVYAVDRQTGLSYEITVRPDGTRDNGAGAPSLSADGSAIAFVASAAMLVDGYANGVASVFVATTVALSPLETEVPVEGGVFLIDVNVPAGTPWTLWSSPQEDVRDADLLPSSGVGPTAVEVSIEENATGVDKTYRVVLGSEEITLRQAGAPLINQVWPSSGPATGGTVVQIWGVGFLEGATVTFGGTPAADVVVVDNWVITLTTPAHQPSEPVHVVVTNPDGRSAERQFGFYYDDTTPPVITSTITGTLGQNGWYTSDVTVSWTVEDGESEIFNQSCDPVTVSADGTQYAWCMAASAGGDSWEQVEIKRDTTPPNSWILLPEPRTYFQGEQVTFYHDCYDVTSDIATCTASQPGAQLHTSAIGTYTLIGTAVDQAGLVATSTESYTVKMATAITVPAVTAVYGTTASLRATLLGSGAPLAGKLIAFTIDNTFVGAATTSGSGEAVLNLPLVGRNAGSYLIGAQFIGDDSSFASAEIGSLEIAKASPVLTWAAPAFIAHGTPLGAAQLNASSTVPGGFVYGPEAGTVLNPGTHTLSAQFTPQDMANYNTASKTVTLKVKAVPTITWATPAPVYYPAFISTHLNATANVPGTFVYNPPWNTLLPGGTHTLSVTFTPANTADYATATASIALVVLKGSPQLTWPYIDPITYKTPLSAAQLKATAMTSGTFTYTPAAGTILPAGTHTLSVTFTPNESNNYEPATATKSLLVGPYPATVMWDFPAPIAYGTPLGPAQQNARVYPQDLVGVWSYFPAPGTVMEVGTHWINVSFNPDDPNYGNGSSYASITVARAPTTITWSTPAPIVYPQPLLYPQLNATASVPGTFSYTPGLGIQLPAGTHSLQVIFNPSDSAHYASAAKTVSIVVAKQTPVITWNNPAPIVYGTALGWPQYNPTVNVGGGSFAQTPPIGTVLNAGAGQTLTVTYWPSNPSSVHSATKSVTIDVLKATPTLTWGNPPTIPYGTPLAAAHLFAAANRPGTFAYSPAAGTVLPAGPHTLSATFTPDDPNYAVTSITTPVNVYKATPVVTWPAPAAITYGTPLSETQLNATANTAGTFSYSPAAGTVLDGGTQTLWLTFTPSDQANYNSPGAITVPIVVNRAVPMVTWPEPAAIVHGTALSAAQLNAAANTTGAFAYAPASGAVLDAGTQALSVTFTPANSINYTTATAGVSIVVTKAAPVVSWPDPSGITYGTALSATQLAATANVPGTFAYSPDAGAVLSAGTQPLSVSFTPTDAVNYTTAAAGVSIVVGKVAPVVSWTNPAGITYGTALSATQLAATANVPGTFAYSPDAGAVLNAGTQPLSVTFTPTDAVNYTTAAAGVSIVVGKVAPVVSWTNPAGLTYGTALSAMQLAATANVPGTFAYSPDAGAVLNAGTQPLSVTFTPTDAANYTTATAGVSIVVGTIAPTVSWTNPAGLTYGAALSSTQLNATANVAGTFAYSPAAGAVLNAGTQPLSVTFTPSDAVNYTTASSGAAIVIAKATPLVTWANPAGINYGTALAATQLNATANVAGTFAYSPAAGTVLGAGTQALAVTFTPTDAGNYNSQAANRSIVVAKVALTLRTVNTSKVYGQALPAFTVSGTSFVNGDTVASLGGTLSFATSATATSAPGSYNVTPSGATSLNYNITFTAGTLTVTKANTAVVLTTTPSPSVNNQTVQLRAVVSAVAPGAGTATGTVQFRDNGVLLGTANLVNGVATLNKSFKRGTRPLTATYVGNTNFNGGSGAKTHQVN